MNIKKIYGVILYKQEIGENNSVEELRIEIEDYSQPTIENIKNRHTGNRHSYQKGGKRIDISSLYVWNWKIYSYYYRLSITPNIQT